MVEVVIGFKREQHETKRIAFLRSLTYCSAAHSSESFFNLP
jgi:hypothetical protein